MRVGVGYDSHRLEQGRRLVLGGIEIPFERGLAGHSDADVLSHAITDAFLGAAALGDIGAHFPPSDPKWKDADSIELLRSACALLEREGFRPINFDATIVCEAPRLAPHIPAMRERLAGATGLKSAALSIKATSNERIGWIGRGEGIAVIAVALIGAVGG